LRVHANAHITAGCYAADAYRDSCRANESTANRRTNRRAADAHRAACCAYKLTANRSATDGDIPQQDR
jgi:hypothetical protein